MVACRWRHWLCAGVMIGHVDDVCWNTPVCTTLSFIYQYPKRQRRAKQLVSRTAVVRGGSSAWLRLSFCLVGKLEGKDHVLALLWAGVATAAFSPWRHFIHQALCFASFWRLSWVLSPWRNLNPWAEAAFWKELGRVEWVTYNQAGICVMAS